MQCLLARRDFVLQHGFWDLLRVVQAELGDIVYVELPEVGSEVKKGEQFGVIESVKVTFCSA